MSFASQLQMLAMKYSTVEDTRKTLTEAAEFFRHLPNEQEVFIPSFSKLRGISVKTLNDFKSFMINPDLEGARIPDKFKHTSLGLFSGARCIYSGRFVFCSQDVKGDVAGFCGYDIDGRPKYLDSLNYGYKAKYSGFLGMEKLPQFYKDKSIIVCEGPICMMYMRDHNLPAVSSLGSHLTPYMITILKRFGDRCLVIPDGDESGSSYRKQVQFKLPNARVVQPLRAKDIDDTRKWLVSTGNKDGENVIADDIEKLLTNRVYSSEYFI